MRLPRGRSVVAALLVVQAFGLVVGFAVHADHRAEAAPVRAPTAPSARATPVPTLTVSAGPVATVPPPFVARLTTRIAPDVLVQSPRTISAAEVAGLLHATAATTSLLVDSGPVHLGGGTTQALGVDPSTFRAWTPHGTAESTPLWQNVARGELAVAHAVAAALRVPLGGSTTIGTAAAVRDKVGAYATTGLPGIGVIVDRTGDVRLGLVRSSALLISAAGQDPVLTAALATKYLADAKDVGTATSTRIPATNGHLQWVAPAYGPITSPYGARPDPLHPGQFGFHPGIDIGAPLGAAIYAAADGVVQYAGPASGFGNEIVLTHSDGVSTVYGHMRVILVTSGPVRAGQPIALVGAEGDATGPHLHFEVHVGSQTVDPAAWLIAHGVDISR